MKAMVLRGIREPLVLDSVPDPDCGPEEVWLELKAAALNRRDLWIQRGRYPGIQTPVVLGSDGAGIVRNVGAMVDRGWIDREVIVNPSLNWGTSAQCQSAEFRILGMPDPGTFATHVKVPVSAIHPKPVHLDWNESAAVPLAGLTAFRALFTQGMWRPDLTVLVTGIGGGVSTWVLQLALAAGARVIVTSSSDDKLQEARKLGAVGTFNYQQAEWQAALRREFGDIQLIIDGSGGDGWNGLLELLGFGGRIVNYGATAGMPARLDLFKIFWKQLHVVGSTMGSPDDFAAMLRFVDHHQIHPVIDRVFPLLQANEALARLEEASHMGKIVLRPELTAI